MTPAYRIEREFISRGRTAAADRQANCCKYCFEPFTVNPATAEHRIPKSKGGSNLAHNIDAACARCNKLKGSLTAGQFLKLIRAGRGPIMDGLELMLAHARRKIWLRTHRACRTIGRSIGIEVESPVGRREAA